MADYISRKDAVEWFASYIMMGEEVIPAETVVGDLKWAIPEPPGKGGAEK